MTDYNQIVWLASYPKSGNTWVRCFLDAYFLGDVDLNEIVCSVIDDHASRYLPGDGSDPRNYPIDIQMLCRGMATLRLVHQYLANRIDGVPLFVKTHNANMTPNGTELLPKSLTKRIIYIVRDPRDVLPSFAKHMGLSIDDAMKRFDDKLNVLNAEGSQKVSDFISSWEMHTRSYLDNDQELTYMVKYEDMLANPVKEFAGILKASGIEPDMERVKTAVARVDIQKLKEKEKQNGFGESSPFAKNEFFGKGGSHGRKKLEPRHFHKLEKDYGRLMKRLGYLRKAAA